MADAYLANAEDAPSLFKAGAPLRVDSDVAAKARKGSQKHSGKKNKTGAAKVKEFEIVDKNSIIDQEAANKSEVETSITHEAEQNLHANSTPKTDAAQAIR